MGSSGRRRVARPAGRREGVEQSWKGAAVGPQKWATGTKMRRQKVGRARAPEAIPVQMCYLVIVSHCFSAFIPGVPGKPGDPGVVWGKGAFRGLAALEFYIYRFLRIWGYLMLVPRCAQFLEDHPMQYSTTSF